jgi:hypothetical protein
VASSGAELHPVEFALAGLTEHVGHRGQHCFLAHHRVHLRLEARAQLHQLGSIAHQLAHLPHLRRRDPRLGQPTQPQQISQVARVALVVFDPAVAPVVARRVLRRQHGLVLGQTAAVRATSVPSQVAMTSARLTRISTPRPT